MALKDHRADMESCCRCSACKFIPLEKITGQEHSNVCPSISRYDFHSHSGGGRMGFGLGLIAGKGGVHAEDGGGRLQLQPVRRLRCLLQVRHGVRRPRAPLRDARGVREERADRPGVGRTGQDHDQGGPHPARGERQTGPMGQGPRRQGLHAREGRVSSTTPGVSRATTKPAAKWPRPPSRCSARPASRWGSPRTTSSAAAAAPTRWATATRP